MSLRRLGAGLLVVAGLGGCAWCVAASPVAPERPGDAREDDLRGGSRTTPSARPSPARRARGERFFLGVNEGMSVPRRLLARGMAPDRLARMLREDGAALGELGATIVRGHTGAFPRTSMAEWNEETRAELDLWVRATAEAGLTPIGMVSPWPANHTARHTTAYVPSDVAAYRAYVAAVVERYDGDGIDDMPGLTAPVRYWEVDNEPDLKFTRTPRPAPREGTAAREVPPVGTFCTPEEYAEVLLASSSAIRTAAPDSTVLAFGLLQPHRESGVDYLRRALAVDGVRASFDVLSVHGYADDGGVSLAQGIAGVRALVPDAPVWVTETSASSAKDEERQARLVVALAARAAEAGASALLWHTLADPPESRETAGASPHDGDPDHDGAGRRGGVVHGVPTALSHNSLFRNSGDGRFTPKPAAVVYTELTMILRAHDLVGARTAGEGLTLLTDGSRLLWKGSAVAENGGRDLRRGRDLAPGESARAPAWLTAPPEGPAR